MRDFLFNSEELLDKKALEFLDKEYIPGILPCKWVRWNNMIQLVYFTNSLVSVSEVLDELSLEEVRHICNEILDYVEKIEKQMDISVENVVWDLDTIYLDEDYQVHIICLPAVIPVEALESRIYVKRVYSIINELFSLKDGGDFICRQIESQREKDPSDWEALRNAIDRYETQDDQSIVLRGINTPDPVEFNILHDEFTIGSDETSDGYIDYPSISPMHAVIGWNEISFYIEDKGSGSGTFLNNVQLSPNCQTPFGRGSIVKFGDYIFNVE